MSDRDYGICQHGQTGLCVQCELTARLKAEAERDEARAEVAALTRARLALHEARERAEAERDSLKAKFDERWALRAVDAEAEVERLQAALDEALGKVPPT